MKNRFRIHVCFNTGEEERFLCESGMSLYHAFLQYGVDFSAPCAGRGTCGGCRIRLLDGVIPVTSSDQKVFTKEQLEKGMRLACRAYPQSDCTILMDSQKTYEVETIYRGLRDAAKQTSQNAAKQMSQDPFCDVEDSLALAVDLGTTTIAYKCFQIANGTERAVYSSVNRQNRYGADVMSRMDASQNGGRIRMAQEIIKQLQEDIGHTLKQIPKKESLRQIALCANTAMIHLMMGYDCSRLCRHPFTPVTLEKQMLWTDELGITQEKIPLTILPGISAYVGGDILMGLTLLHLQDSKKPMLFIDIGTNAEMALADGKGQLYVTSAPAGPAFEGGDISCGTGSVPGAIEKVSMFEGDIKVQTIGSEEPVGICGSGILDAVYELYRNGIIDETGLFKEPYFESGFMLAEKKDKEKLIITQQDVRKVQMAKSAIASACEVLIKRADITEEELDCVYLAGGFGTHLNIQATIGIGMFPQSFRTKLVIAGNTALQGVKEYLEGNLSDEEIEACRMQCREIYLSQEEDFQEIYLSNMYLPPQIDDI